MFAKATSEKTIAERLMQASSFPHEVGNLQLLETHISWVILTGRYAYKIKKPVSFDFVDYSTLELRKEFCLKEFELNRRFAPELYLGVVPIYQSDGNLVVGDRVIQDSTPDSENTAIDYAVWMHEFPQDSILAARLDHDELTSQSVDQFGKHLAEVHGSIDSSPPSNELGHAAGIERDAMDNFLTLQNAFQFDTRIETVQKLQQQTRFQLAKLKPNFERRRYAGKVRHCHGDLHLKNIIQSKDRLIAFDGIEFNKQFQWIDVLSELAFPVMDFAARGRADLGWRLLNAYLESTDDYIDLDVLRFYLIYRALVRAKVTWLNPANHTSMVREKYSVDDAEVNKLAGPWDKYLSAACYFAFDLKPKLSITFGFSGSGKSTMAMNLIEQEGGVRIRADVERQKLAEKFESEDKYSEEMNDWVYVHLAELARCAIAGGFSVIVDATFLNHSRRALFQALAEKHDVDFQILACDAPIEELCQRISARGSDPSEATIAVLNKQMETHDPLTTDELQFVRAQIE